MRVKVNDLVLRHVHDVADADLVRFLSGCTQVNEFLLREASRGARGIARSVLVFLQGREDPVGYFSLSVDSVRLTGSQEFNPLDAPVSYLPAVKLTKLSTTSELQSQGIGEAVLRLICGMVADAPFAVRFLTVDALNQPRIIAFYERLGFRASVSVRQEPQPQPTPPTVLMLKDLYL